MKYALIALSIALTACEVSINPTVNVDDNAAQPKVAQPADAEVAQEPIAQQSVFKNWGHNLSNELSLDFSNVGSRITDCYSRNAPNCELKIDANRQSWFIWNQYEAGHYGENGREIRSCTARLTFSGTQESGQLTISNADMMWTIHPNADQHSTYCTDFNGTYDFEVTQSGKLIISGLVYDEVQ